MFDVTPAGAIGAGWPAAVLTAGDEPPRYIFPSRPRGVRRGFAAAPPRAIRESALQRWWLQAVPPDDANMAGRLPAVSMAGDEPQCYIDHGTCYRFFH